MNGSTEHRASDAGETLSRPQALFNLGTGRRLVSLLRRIVPDILAHQRNLDQLGLEQETLDRQRRTLNWPQRQRRYEVQEQLAISQRELEDARAELEVLGAVLIDAREGLVGLPTVVNGRLAYFTWKPSETTLQYWQFPREKIRRTIPASWSESATMAVKNNG